MIIFTYRRIQTVVELKKELPEIFEEFAEQVLSEDVKSFVTVFVTAKKSGGDMIGIIRNTANQI